MFDWVKKSVSFCIKWRYLIALVVFILCVVLKLHGSSINEFNKIFANYDEYESESIILGESRAIRGDEWLVHTPYYMSQYYNDFAKDSNAMSLEGQDMIVGYNAPVADISIIAKPFTWGYVLLGNEYGLSWYWCSKLILLILVSFEACMIITQKNKKVSLLGTIMIAFAPAVQWWFVPHMVDVLFWGMAVFVLAYYFFTSEKWLRVLYMVLLPLSVVTFVLALFPSLQLSIGLVMLALFVVCMVRDKKIITFHKKDIWRMILMATVVLGILGYEIWTSKDAISAIYNTVYPGKRVSLGGGGGFKILFTDLTSFVLPFKEITYSNSCEISTFIQFAPIFLMLYPVIWKKMKRDKNMLVGNALLICIIVMAAFMLVGFPILLAKLTGFSYIDTNRMKFAYGLTATLFTIWGMDMIWKRKIFSKKQILITTAIYGICYILFIWHGQELTYLNWKHYLVIIAGLATLVYLVLGGHQRICLVGVAVLVLIPGVAVNPVARGIVAVTEHPLEQKINEIAASDDAYWLAVDNYRLAQLGIANGAKVLNAVNFYPDYGKWNIVDEAGEHDDIYNRYAHIYTSLTDGETEYSAGHSPDAFSVKFSCEDLKKMNIKYLLIEGSLETCKNDFEKIYQDTEGDYYIYRRVNYEEKNS